MARVFGTDGVRGLANADLTASSAIELCVAAAQVLGAADRRPSAVVARDTRASGEFLEAAVIAGLTSAGVDVHRLGVLPTPGAAYLTAEFDADFGVVISASHNPMPDNGIKFFGRGGEKLDDAVERQIEARIDAIAGEPWSGPTGDDIGRVLARPDGLERYISHLVQAGPAPLQGLRIVLDCANGAAYRVGPEVFAQLGAEVTAIHADPDGLNINDRCGSTHMGDLQKAVVGAGADIGFAFDGDADRALAVDRAGAVVDGDHILAMLAVAARDAGHLAQNTVVATVMSNLGFIHAMTREGITVLQTAVGDRYVLEAMRANDLTLGGEQSGHIILSDHATTGDGVLTAVTVAALLARSGRPLHELASVMNRLPQVLVNVDNVDKTRAETDPDVAQAVQVAADEMGDSGRVLLRQSGTEPLVRVMVEAPTPEQARDTAERIADVVRTRLSL